MYHMAVGEWHMPHDIEVVKLRIAREWHMPLHIDVVYNCDGGSLHLRGIPVATCIHIGFREWHMPFHIAPGPRCHGDLSNVLPRRDQVMLVDIPISSRWTQALLVVPIPMGSRRIRTTIVLAAATVAASPPIRTATPMTVCWRLRRVLRTFRWLASATAAPAMPFAVM